MKAFALWQKIPRLLRVLIWLAIAFVAFQAIQRYVPRVIMWWQYRDYKVHDERLGDFRPEQTFYALTHGWYDFAEARLYFMEVRGGQILGFLLLMICSFALLFFVVRTFAPRLTRTRCLKLSALLTTAFFILFSIGMASSALVANWRWYQEEMAKGPIHSIDYKLSVYGYFAMMTDVKESLNKYALEKQLKPGTRVTLRELVIHDPDLSGDLRVFSWSWRGYFPPEVAIHRVCNVMIVGQKFELHPTIVSMAREYQVYMTPDVLP